MKALLVGGGRMGQRHLLGLLRAGADVVLIEPNPEARSQAIGLAGPRRIDAFPVMEDVPQGYAFDLAILSATAKGRLEQLQAVLDRRIPAVLCEKPLEQSRARTRAFIAAAGKSGSRVFCNHYRRNLPGYQPLRAAGGPFIITVTSGAMGLGCNGIHWIDFALHLTNGAEGALLYGEVEPVAIGSGRGKQFRDYGGRALFGFPDGSRLYLSSSASSSAPTVMSILTPTSHWIVDQGADRAFIHERRPGVELPNYLYGQEYAVREVTGLETADFPRETEALVRNLMQGVSPTQPPLHCVATSYELLFDLLERSGHTEFQFT